MLNQVVLVGKIKYLKDNMLLISVSTNEKDEKGNYKKETIRVGIFGKLENNVLEYCHKNDIIGVKGKLVTGNHIVAEKVTFLSSSKSNK